MLLRSIFIASTSAQAGNKLLNKGLFYLVDENKILVNKQNSGQKLKNYEIKNLKIWAEEIYPKLYSNILMFSFCKDPYKYIPNNFLSH